MKPQNVIISEMHNCCKLIDLGAAADLRIGINYIPDEFLLDPRYAPPQQYIMSPQTVRREAHKLTSSLRRTAGAVALFKFFAYLLHHNCFQ